MKYTEAKKLGDLSETPLVGSRENVDRAIQIGEAVDKHRVEHFDKALKALHVELLFLNKHSPARATVLRGIIKELEEVEEIA